eukprot:5955456-Pleurochrysis_carterae.AAC.10
MFTWSPALIRARLTVFVAAVTVRGLLHTQLWLRDPRLDFDSARALCEKRASRARAAAQMAALRSGSACAKATRRGRAQPQALRVDAHAVRCGACASRLPSSDFSMLWPLPFPIIPIDLSACLPVHFSILSARLALCFLLSQIYSLTRPPFLLSPFHPIP